MQAVAKEQRRLHKQCRNWNKNEITGIDKWPFHASLCFTECIVCIWQRGLYMAAWADSCKPVCPISACDVAIILAVLACKQRKRPDLYALPSCLHPCLMVFHCTLPAIPCVACLNICVMIHIVHNMPLQVPCGLAAHHV